MSNQFNVDPLRTKLQAAKTVVPAKVAAAAAPAAVESMLDLADECLAVNEFDLAAQAIKLAKAIAVAVKDPALGKMVVRGARKLPPWRNSFRR